MPSSRVFAGIASARVRPHACWPAVPALIGPRCGGKDQSKSAAGASMQADRGDFDEP
jgi:hypothetical protein